LVGLINDNTSHNIYLTIKGMIDVFEKWFSQFTKPEQERLLKHIWKNHLNLKDGSGLIPLDNKEKRIFSSSLNSSIQKKSSTTSG